MAGGGGGGMAMDPRQVVAGFLTLSMFVMIGNMIKHDHFDSAVEVTIQDTSSVTQFDASKLEEHNTNKMSEVTTIGPWKEQNKEYKACWAKPSSNMRDSKGFVTFSLLIGPEYHISQVSDAVVIARHLGATLVLPDIRRNGDKRNFADLYDLEAFSKSLHGVVNIAHELPPELRGRKPAVVKVPHRVTKDFIEKNIKSIFAKNDFLRVAVSFPSPSLNAVDSEDKELESTACLSMFTTLEPKLEITQVADQIVERLRTLSRNSNSQFVAIDLRLQALKKKSCTTSANSRRKRCYNAQEIADFLKKIGFGAETTVYLTETRWHESLNPLKNAFPNTYTKDDVITADKKGVLNSGGTDFARSLDLLICSKADVFVPAFPSIFYSHVTGKRIASGQLQIIVPSEASMSRSPSDFVSTYISRKNHFAYSCYC